MQNLKIILIISLLFTANSCNNISENKNSEINIAVTLPPFADFVKQIAGDKAEIFTLVPSNSNAHSFEPTPERLGRIVESDLFFTVGGKFKFENLLLSKINLNKEKIVDCSVGIEFINNNPHYWLSPKNVKIITNNIFNSLVIKYPEYTDYFKENKLKYNKKVDSLDNIVKGSLDNIKNRILFVYHPAWIYFAKHYQLEQISVENEGKTPNAQDMVTLMKSVKNMGVNSVFFDPHFDNSSVQTIASYLKIEIASLDPLPENYLETLDNIRLKLIKYLK